jgi:anti-sigma factor RsiW
MSCDEYEKFENGKLKAGIFARHLQDCPECREREALAARLDREISALRAPIGAEGLWERIETSLRREKETAAARAAERPVRSPGPGLRRWLIFAPAGAALIVLAVLGIQALRRTPPGSGILSEAALARVEASEKEYMAAIDDLAGEVRPKVAAMDFRMMSLYRDKLAAIDTQIAKCREALDSNPGNAHIRSYLLAALQDKRQVLTDAAGSMN